MLTETKGALIEAAIGLRDDVIDWSIVEDEEPWNGNPHMTAEHLKWMLTQIEENAEEWPVDKTGRWLGYVQGILVSVDALDVTAERDRTRLIFRPAYERDGLRAPATKERT